MNTLQVRAHTSLDIVSVNLSDLIAMPDPEAAEAMNQRMAIFELVHKMQERSYVERGVIIREFERRNLWEHLTDPDTGQAFPNLTAWLSCSSFLGCRRTNFEVKADMKLLADIPSEQLIGITEKSNLKVLAQLSTAVRNEPGILEAAKRLPQDEFLEKVEKEQPLQHIEMRRVMRFHPGRSWAKVIEETISYAIEHSIADTRDEALLRMAETALNEWQLEEEIKNMPVEAKQ